MKRDLSLAARRRIQQLLAWSRHHVGADRCYVVNGRQAGDVAGGPSAALEVCDPPEACGNVSQTLYRLALESVGPVVSIDVPGDRRFDERSSVRSLDLRYLVAMALREGSRTARVIVLAGCRPTQHTAHYLSCCAEALAAMVRLALESETWMGMPSGTSLPAASAPGVGQDHSIKPETGDDWIARVGQSSLSVLIQGETGAGKELAARQLHDCSRRSRGPFIALNCAALTETLLDAELFGAVRGAYTGADRERSGLFRQADGGTLFLDEVGDMPQAMQPKLLRALETGRVRPVGGTLETSVDVRVIGATNRDMAQRIRSGRFREDLYYRLAVAQVRVPPLRERIADLPQLIKALEQRLQRETGFGPPQLTAAAWSALMRHPWPGNVRELHSVLAQALLRAGKPEIDLHDLDLTTPSTSVPPGTERELIERALNQTGGCITHAAAQIGWNRQRLYRRLKATGVDVTRYRRSNSAGTSDHQDQDQDDDSGKESPGAQDMMSSDSSTFQ